MRRPEDYPGIGRIRIRGSEKKSVYRKTREGSSHARSGLVDDLMGWRNVVIARPGSPVTGRRVSYRVRVLEYRGYS